MIYDAQKNEILPRTAESVGGVKGFISWRRLTHTLREIGEVQQFEDVTHLEIDERGISIVVVQKTNAARERR